MKKAWPIVLLASVLFAAPLRAQEKPTEPPRPPAEVQRLADFLGTWNSVAEVKPNAVIPAGRHAWTDKCEWFPGGFHLVCYSAGSSPKGSPLGLKILGYDAAEKTYTSRGIDSSGSSTTGKGVVKGDTWTWTSKEKLGGKTLHVRRSMSFAGTSYTFRHETSENGKNWTLVMEGKATRPVKKERPPFRRPN